ncbi:MAG: hypothetical protein EBT98_11410, partial [Opitutaceae bacterium]|nr:hypothetical protein [Opitutaceae bacterium]
MDSEPLIAAFRAAGQEQVFAHWPRLSAAQRAGLLAQAAEIDLQELARLNNALVVGADAASSVNLAGLAPAPWIQLPTAGGDAQAWAQAEASGAAALRQGRVAAFTVAGGQGTRLGYPGPKGTFPVTPIKQKTLFQLFAEKIKADPAALAILIRESEGSVRDAMNLLEQVRFIEAHITVETVTKALGYVSDFDLINLLDLTLSCDLSLPSNLLKLDLPNKNIDFVWRRLCELLKFIVYLKHGVPLQIDH